MVGKDEIQITMTGAVCKRCGAAGILGECEECSKFQSEIAKLHAEVERLKAQKNVADPFEWMKSWLEAYDKANDCSSGKDAYEWVMVQPCGAG